MAVFHPPFFKGHGDSRFPFFLLFGRTPSAACRSPASVASRASRASLASAAGASLASAGALTLMQVQVASTASSQEIRQCFGVGQNFYVFVCFLSGTCTVSAARLCARNLFFGRVHRVGIRRRILIR